MTLQDLQATLNYSFKNESLLQTALVHRSYMHDRRRDSSIQEHNERLEFLGDAVLELIVTDHLYNNLGQNEGIMTAVRASLVNYKTLGQVGMELGLNDAILLSRSEQEDNGRARLNIIADCVEAILGAMYLDGGIQPCQKLIVDRILILTDEIITAGTYKDAKTKIQEFIQKHFKITPHYKVVSSSGKDHEKEFEVALLIGDDMITKGAGYSKQDAETLAAQKAYTVLQERIESDQTLPASKTV